MNDTPSKEQIENLMREGRRAAAKGNTGAPCDVCGAKQKKLDIRRLPDGGVFVGISAEFPANLAKREIAGLRSLLKSFEDGCIAPTKAKRVR